MCDAPAGGEATADSPLSGIPQHLWQTVQEKVDGSLYDASNHFELDFHNGRWYVRTTRPISAGDPTAVFLVDHTVTYLNREHLMHTISATPGLLARLRFILDLEELQDEPADCAAPEEYREIDCTVVASGSMSETEVEQAIEVRPSRIPGAGDGAFTTVELPAGMLLGHYEGERMNKQEVQERYKDCAPRYALRVSVDGADGENTTEWIDAANPDKSNWLRYINHCQSSSVDCNCQLLDNGTATTIRRIEPGSELMFDYGVNYGAEYWKKIRFSTAQGAAKFEESDDADTSSAHLLEVLAVIDQLESDQCYCIDDEQLGKNCPVYYCEDEFGYRLHNPYSPIAAAAGSQNEGQLKSMGSKVVNFAAMGLAFTVFWPLADMEAGSVVNGVQRY